MEVRGYTQFENLRAQFLADPNQPAVTEQYVDTLRIKADNAQQAGDLGAHSIHLDRIAVAITYLPDHQDVDWPRE